MSIGISPAGAQTVAADPQSTSSRSPSTIHPPAARSAPPQSAPPRPALSRGPGDPPTRERKLKAISFDQVDAARALIKPQPLPQRKANKIVFEPDDTPPDAEHKLGLNEPVGPVNKKKPGPTPRSAPQQQLAQQAETKAARAAITPKLAIKPAARSSAAADADSGGGPGPALDDAEMDQIDALVQAKYGPILDISQAAEVSKLAKQTIRERVYHGLYADSVVRGRPLRFWAHPS